MRRLLTILVLILTTGAIRAQTITQTNLPIVKISFSGNPANNQIPGTIEIIHNGSGLNAPNDAPYYAGSIGVKERGSSSNPKKSYNVETWTHVIEQSLDTSLLGMPSENDWVLLACYTDRSLIRDLVGFHIYEKMGYWAPRMRLVEVMINGSYEGVYLFGERIKRDNERIDIATLNNIDNSGLELTGGYIFKIDNSNDGFWTSSFPPPYASASQDIKFHYEEPEDDDITPVQRNYIKAYTDSFEAALNSVNFQDTTTGWRGFAGHNSFEDYLIFNEVIKSRDAYRQSTYIFKDKGKKLRAGPPWDLELSLYNTADCNASVDNGWAWEYGQHCNTSTYLPPFWWEKLTQDTMYMRITKCKYTHYRNSFLDTNNLFAFIDSLENLLNAEQAQQRNFQKWPIWGVPLVNEPVPLSSSHAEEVAKIRGFLGRRFQYLDGEWLSPGCILNIQTPEAGELAASLFPNPAGSAVRLQLNPGKQADIEVVINDVSGRIVYRQELGKVHRGGSEFELQLDRLEAGMYLVSVNAADGTSKKMKLIKR